MLADVSSSRSRVTTMFGIVMIIILYNWEIKRRCEDELNKLNCCLLSVCLERRESRVVRDRAQKNNDDDDLVNNGSQISQSKWTSVGDNNMFCWY